MGLPSSGKTIEALRARGLAVAQSDVPHALALLRDNVAQCERLFGGWHPNLALDLFVLALAHLRIGGADDAAAVACRGLQVLSSAEQQVLRDPQHWGYWFEVAVVGVFLVLQIPHCREARMAKEIRSLSSLLGGLSDRLAGADIAVSAKTCQGFLSFATGDYVGMLETASSFLTSLPRNSGLEPKVIVEQINVGLCFLLLGCPRDALVELTAALRTVSAARESQLRGLRETENSSDDDLLLASCEATALHLAGLGSFALNNVRLARRLLLEGLRSLTTRPLGLSIPRRGSLPVHGSGSTLARDSVYMISTAGVSAAAGLSSLLSSKRSFSLCSHDRGLAVLLHNLAVVELRAGSLAEALDHALSALTLLEGLDGVVSPRTLSTYLLLADIYRASGALEHSDVLQGLGREIWAASLASGFPQPLGWALAGPPSHSSSSVR